MSIYGASDDSMSPNPQWTETMQIRQKLKAYFENQRALRELEALDDRILSDLGVSRSNLRSAIKGRS
jgi:uncharacterized protein YjiS (DUF1127 family)